MVCLYSAYGIADNVHSERRYRLTQIYVTQLTLAFFSAKSKSKYIWLVISTVYLVTAYLDVKIWSMV